MLKETNKKRLLSVISSFDIKYLAKLRNIFCIEYGIFDFLLHTKFFSVDSKNRVVGLVNFDICNKKLDGIVIVSHKNSPIPMLDLIRSIKKLKDEGTINEVEFMAKANHPMIERYKEIVLKYKGTIENTNNNNVIMNIKFKVGVIQKIKNFLKGRNKNGNKGRV